jgi:hypothetical protein
VHFPATIFPKIINQNNFIWKLFVRKNMYRQKRLEVNLSECFFWQIFFNSQKRRIGTLFKEHPAYVFDAFLKGK